MEFNRHLTTIDAHAAGEPLRIITGGLPQIKGKTILEKRAFFLEHYDHIRKVLMYEPRGHHGMYGCIMTPPVSDDADFGVLFMHNEGFSTMCGHGIIAIVTVAIETGVIIPKDNITKVIIDSPAGKIIAYAECKGSRVLSVTFENVPSFVYAKDVELKVLNRTFTVDIAFGGAFYVIVQAKDIGVNVDIEELPKLQEWGTAIKESIESTMLVQHPLEKDLKGIYGVIVSDKPKKSNSDLRNVTIFADAQIDRSPCGTGTAARLAVLYNRKELGLDQEFVHESIIGSQFIGKIVSETKVGQYNAVIPTIKGRAFITGFHQFIVDPTDSLAKGFLLS